MSLGRLSHLTELHLSKTEWAIPDLATVTEAHIQPLIGVRQLRLEWFDFQNGTVATLFRFISRTFPNLNKLHIRFGEEVRKATARKRAVFESNDSHTHTPKSAT